MSTRLGIFFLAGIVLAFVSCEKDTEIKDYITFEELDPGGEGYWNGSDESGGFTSGNAFFPNSFTDWGEGMTSWSGFAYSNHSDRTTPGYANQYSCYAGEGAGKSEMFALITIGDTLTFTVPERVDKISVSNSTYSALSMKNGDDFAKKFGGEEGSDPDFFHLIITGIDEEGQVTGTLTLGLADNVTQGEVAERLRNTPYAAALVSNDSPIDENASLEEPRAKAEHLAKMARADGGTNLGLATLGAIRPGGGPSRLQCLARDRRGPEDPIRSHLLLAPSETQLGGSGPARAPRSCFLAGGDAQRARASKALR